MEFRLIESITPAYEFVNLQKHILQSGTVGNPKAVMLSHDNLVHDAQMLISTLQVNETSDTIISYLPLSHVAAQVRS